MIKLLIGGSPCTFWSIAQKNDRETEPKGLGWELFKNYLIAKEKFKPDFFLYENNKSAAQAIKDQIKKEMNVWDGTLLMEDTEARYIEINSALVSAQNRQRFCVHNCGDVGQPEDRGIVLRDILQSGVSFGANGEKTYALTAPVGDTNGKAFCLTSNYPGAYPEHTLTKSVRTMVAEPINITEDGKAQVLKANYHKSSVANFFNGDGGMKFAATGVCEPIRIGSVCDKNGNAIKGQAGRVFSVDGKSTTLMANAGGMGGKTGLYAIPYELSEEYYKGGADSSLIGMTTDGEGKYRNGNQPSQQYRVYSCEDKSQVVNTVGNENYIVPTTENETAFSYIYKQGDKFDGKPVYEVKNGFITIKGKQYPIKLADGYYIIRKLTPIECERLQTLPDNYTAAVSNTQRYKGLGNGWTAEVIIHILNGALKDVPRDEEIVVLSMYDGIGTGRYCLDKMGFTNVKYFAYEKDKYAKQVAMSNYPDIIQMGDAFDIRHPDWTIGY